MGFKKGDRVRSVSDECTDISVGDIFELTCDEYCGHINFMDRNGFLRNRPASLYRKVEEGKLMICPKAGECLNLCEAHRNKHNHKLSCDISGIACPACIPCAPEVIEVGDTVETKTTNERYTYIVDKITKFMVWGHIPWRWGAAYDWCNINNLKLVKKGAKPMEKEVMIDFKDLLDEGAQMDCSHFKQFLDIYGAKKVSVKEVYEKAKSLGNADAAVWIWLHFPLSFPVERTYATGNTFERNGCTFRLYYVGELLVQMLGLGGHEWCDKPLKVVNPRCITNEEMQRITGFRDWKSEYKLIED